MPESLVLLGYRDSVTHHVTKLYIMNNNASLRLRVGRGRGPAPGPALPWSAALALGGGITVPESDSDRAITHLLSVLPRLPVARIHPSARHGNVERFATVH